MIKCVGFDLDGTLYDERSYVDSCYDAIAMSINPEEKDDIKAYMHRIRMEKGDQAVFQHVIGHYALDQGALEDFVRIYRTCNAQIQLYPDAEAFLNKPHLWKLALLTNGGVWTQKNKCCLLKLNRFFDEICITGQLPRNYWKPAHEAFEWLCEKMNIHPDECLYVGDQWTNDYEGAISAGLHACLIDREDRYKGVSAVRIRSFDELEDYVSRIGE